MIVYPEFYKDSARTRRFWMLILCLIFFQPLESDMLALNIRKVGPGSKYNIHEIPSVDGKHHQIALNFFVVFIWQKEKCFTRGYLLNNSKQQIYCGGLPIMS